MLNITQVQLRFCLPHLWPTYSVRFATRSFEAIRVGDSFEPIPNHSVCIRLCSELNNSQQYRSYKTWRGINSRDASSSLWTESLAQFKWTESLCIRRGSSARRSPTRRDAYTRAKQRVPSAHRCIWLYRVTPEPSDSIHVSSLDISRNISTISWKERPHRR